MNCVMKSDIYFRADYVYICCLVANFYSLLDLVS